MQRQTEYKTKLLAVNPIDKAIVNFSSLLNIATMVLAILLPTKNKNAKESGVVEFLFKHSKPLFVIAIFLQIHDLKQLHKQFNYQAEGVLKEIRKSQKALEGFFQPKHKAIIDAVKQDRNDPSQVSYLTDVGNTNLKKQVRLTWQVGHGQILEQANNIKMIFDELAKLFPFEQIVDYFTEKEMTELFPNNTFPQLPAALKSKYGPYMTRIQDFPSKVRNLNHFTLLAFLASESIYRWMKEPYDLSIKHRFLLYLAYAAIQWPVNMVDSYIRRDNATKLNLEGYSNQYPPYNALSTNCIGQQLKQCFVLYPKNPAMNEVIEYILGSKKVLDALISNGVVNDKNIPEDLNNDIKSFIEIFSDDNNIATIDFSRKRQ